MQKILLIEAAAYDLLSSVPLHKRSEVAGYLRDIANLLESDYPLIHRRPYDVRLLDGLGAGRKPRPQSFSADP